MELKDWLKAVANGELVSEDRFIEFCKMIPDKRLLQVFIHDLEAKLCDWEQKNVSTYGTGE